MPLQLDIVTPEKTIFSDMVEHVYLPGADGEMGVLPQHAGLVTALKPGELRYAIKGKEHFLAIGSGFAEVNHSRVVVLTDSALGEAEIDEAAAEEAIKRAQQKLSTADSNLDPDEAAFLQNIIEKSAAAIQFKRKKH
ncbi:MAG: ATP synthase F1 subunit epsilon [Verrucomicrobia bacterium]|nr:MAG: ATP synthase F1 subunit epsilon [Verrucomicrobiota bacterium]